MEYQINQRAMKVIIQSCAQVLAHSLAKIPLSSFLSALENIVMVIGQF